MTRRGEGDVWTGLYEFPMIETSKDCSVSEIQDEQLFGFFFKKDVFLQPIGNPINLC